jgi:hypothetical protein
MPVVPWAYKFVKSHQNKHVKWVHFIGHKLCLTKRAFCNMSMEGECWDAEMIVTILIFREKWTKPCMHIWIIKEKEKEKKMNKLSQGIKIFSSKRHPMKGKLALERLLFFKHSHLMLFIPWFFNSHSFSSLLGSLSLSLTELGDCVRESLISSL